MTTSPQGEGAAPQAGAPPFRLARTRAALGALLWAILGALMVAALSQIPTHHDVDIGGRDAAYIQGFHAPEPAGTPELAGSDGSARWTSASSALLFPQAGLPGSVTLRLRGPAEQEPVEVAILLNGATELARARPGASWESVAVPIEAGLLKATDFFVELRATTTALPDGRQVGMLIDRVSYTVGPGPIAAYPTQLAFGAVAGALVWALLKRRGAWVIGVALLAYGLLWLFLYRLQPPLYPYPLRAMPLWAVGGLGALLALRDGPALAARWPRLVDTLAPAAVIGGWAALTLLAARGHVTLSRPGVENDFRVFATRESLAQVFSADGFYNLGYPLLLWLARQLFDGNAFLAGRLVAALSGATLLAACYWLARSLLPPGPALLALTTLALSGLVTQYGLYVGSDMPFAACVALCVAALIAELPAFTPRPPLPQGEMGSPRTALPRTPPSPAQGERGWGGEGHRLWRVALAGVFGGLAFLMRHPGLVLLPWGLLVLLAVGLAGRGRADVWRPTLAFTVGFLLAMAPQVVINVVQAGQPLYNQQAKNIWLAVYGGTDWGRWEEAPNSIGLAEVVLRDPRRFLDNWWRNVVAYIGSGAEDTSEFGRALQLRLLGFPANWLAISGLLTWAMAATRGWKTWSFLPRARAQAGTDSTATPQSPASSLLALLLLVSIYVAAVSTAFNLQRFFLPLTPIYAVAAGWAAWRLTRGGRALLGLALALVVVLWGGSSAGASYVLDSQPADEVAIVQMVEAAAEPGALVAARVAGRLPVAKYSAIAHRVVEWPAGADLGQPISAADLAAARAAGATYVIWDEATGPPPLADPAPARVTGEGRYALYRITE